MAVDECPGCGDLADFLLEGHAAVVADSPVTSDHPGARIMSALFEAARVVREAGSVDLAIALCLMSTGMADPGGLDRLHKLLMTLPGPRAMVALYYAAQPAPTVI